MRCNPRLYHEISSLLYQDHSVHVAIDARPYDWAILKSHSKILSTLQCCTILDKATAGHRLRNLPFQSFRTQEITVTIQPPLLCEAEHIMLAEKINKLVDIIYELPWTPRIRVILIGEWIIEEPSVSQRRRLGQHRISTVKSKLNGKYFYYCDAAILPFTRVENWQFSIPTNLHELLSTDTRFRRSFLYRFTRSSHTSINSQALWEGVEAKEIVQWRLICRRVLDHELDKVMQSGYGPNAVNVRRERLRYWYRPGDSWNSDYEKQVWTDLLTDFDAVMMLDPGLATTQRKSRLLIRFHDMAFKHFARLPLWSIECPITHVWNPVAIFQKWNYCESSGTYPRTEYMRNEDDRLRDQYSRVRFNRYVSEVPHCREYWADLQWWGSSAYNFMSERLVGPKVCPQCLELNASCQWCQKFNLHIWCPLCGQTPSGVES
ncbi:hypothetical protein N7488_005061 [Penicillium malachiteum]|nr:hypothetical protein N7488_005061 [Penicillium malachiteum]